MPVSDIAAALPYRYPRHPALHTGNPDDMHAIEDHLEHLRLLGHSAATIYGRATFLRMLARQLDTLRSSGAGYGIRVSRSGPHGGPHIAPAPGILLSATVTMLAAWRAGLDVSDEVIVHYVCHAASFYAWCVREGLRPDNPAAGLPVPRTGRRLPRPVSEDDLMRALECAPGRIRPWLVLGGWCGFRACEVAYLRRECVLDTARPPVLIVAQEATKGRRERSVAMSAFVLGEIVPVLSASGWVFTRRDGKRGPNSPGFISHLANLHLHDCGVPASFHQLRHRFGTQFYRASGRDLRLTQEAMGHARPDTTALYTLTDNPEAVAAVEAIPAPARLRVAR